MPLYEYRCNQCRQRTQLLMRAYDPPQTTRCGACGSEDTRRLFSAPVVHKSEAQRLADLGDSSQAGRDPDYYKDSRNVGLWAKKRAQELGADLGPQFDEVVERARTGKILDDYES